MSTPPPPPPPRKVPPPCWTHDETLALIDAYRDRWLSLRRGYLRSSDWDAVATAVSLRCHLVSPPKSSAQCRHKIEKLRQRYRAEKQRYVSFPGKFFSSWVFFGNLDFIDEGSTSAMGSNQDTDQGIDPGGRFGVKTLGDRNLVRRGFVGSKNFGNVDGISNPNVDLGHDLDDGVNGGGGFCIKSLGDRNSVPLGFVGSKNYGKIDGKPKFDFGHDVDAGCGFPLKSLGDRSSVPPGFRSKNYGKIDSNSDSNLDFDHEIDDGTDAGGGIRKKTSRDRSSVPLRFRSKNYSNINGNSDPNFDFDHNVDDGINSGCGFHINTPGDWHSVPPRFRPKNYGNIYGTSNSNLDSSVLNGCSSSSRLKFVRKSGGGRIKREMDPVAEMVSSIKLLGECFMKMEKMKMEMARDIEKMRMEMEMKRNEMLLESQRHIVDAFVKGFLEKKVKMMVSPDS